MMHDLVNDLREIAARLRDGTMDPDRAVEAIEGVAALVELRSLPKADDSLTYLFEDNLDMSMPGAMPAFFVEDLGGFNTTSVGQPSMADQLKIRPRYPRDTEVYVDY